jgi:NADH-quinone oxidoreductase subunit J
MDPQRLIPIATVLGALGLWLLLPRGNARGRVGGGVLALAGLGVWASQLPGLGDRVGGAVLWILAAVTIISAIATVTFRSPVYCAIWFGMTLVGTAGLFLPIGAQFLAVATLVVYAGAILVMFLFVLMLSHPEGRAPYDRLSWEALLSAATGAVIIGILSLTIASVLSGSGRLGTPIAPPSEEALSNGVLVQEHVARLGMELFGRHLVDVEAAGALLLAALVGAAVIVAQGRVQREKREQQIPLSMTRNAGAPERAGVRGDHQTHLDPGSPSP